MLLDSILDAVGDVPLLRLARISSGNVFAKAEFLNPGGSVKDRVAKRIIEAAEEDGTLQPGMTILEATSGNTGIGLTLVGVQKGYQVRCVMPDNASEERKKIIEAFGGEAVFVPAEEGLAGDGATPAGQGHGPRGRCPLRAQGHHGGRAPRGRGGGP